MAEVVVFVLLAALWRWWARHPGVVSAWLRVQRRRRSDRRLGALPVRPDRHGWRE
jgi:hypothetical protein